MRPPLQNMFLAIINDTYATVKEELRTQKSEYELGDLFRKVGTRVHIRVDIQMLSRITT
jgi:hypothetical protein